jgi:hypothetical protein
MIIGVCGLISSGKGTVANYLTTFHGFKSVSFAGSLKDAISGIFGWDRELLEGNTKRSREWREERDEWWSKRLGMDITPRWILQYWGTDIFRNKFHDEIWIASLENKLRQTKDDIVITDCRFKNELESIKKAGGITVRVNRGPNPSWYPAAEAYNKGPSRNLSWAISRGLLEKAGIHASEYSSVGLDYDFHIENGGTIDDLHKKIDLIINS